MKIKVVRHDGSVEEIELDPKDYLEFELLNSENEPVKCNMTFGTWTTWIGVAGYGNLTELPSDRTYSAALDVYHHDTPASSYNYEHPSAGHAMFMIWSDINEEEADIHTLAGARNDN